MLRLFNKSYNTNFSYKILSIVIKNKSLCKDFFIAKHFQIKHFYNYSQGEKFTRSINKSHKPLSCYQSVRYKMDVIPEGVFHGVIDRFNGVTIDSNDEYVENEDFADKLNKSLEHWRAVNRRAIWFVVHTIHADWINILVKNGFDFHHAKIGSVTLFRWLPEEETLNMPDFAHTLIGVGGLVINDRKEILAVSDRFAMIPNSWKLPGGYVDPGEDFVNAAIREVREETGIDCTFHSVVSLRHAHGGMWHCSDLYITIALTPLHLNLKRCEREIAKLAWMPIEEFLVNPNVHKGNRELLLAYLDYEKRGLRFTYEKTFHPVLKREYCLYQLKPLDEKCDSTDSEEKK